MKRFLSFIFLLTVTGSVSANDEVVSAIMLSRAGKIYRCAAGFITGLGSNIMVGDVKKANFIGGFTATGVNYIINQFIYEYAREYKLNKKVAFAGAGRDTMAGYLLGFGVGQLIRHSITQIGCTLKPKKKANKDSKDGFGMPVSSAI